MTAIGRAFVAVEPPTAVRDELEARVRVLREGGHTTGLRFVTSWHLTLQFFGRVDDAEALVGALAGTLAGVSAPVVRLGGAGAFPRARRGTVLWIGTEEGGDDLAHLSASIGCATAPLGLAAEARRFRPHVTLARSTARDLRAAVDALGDDAVGPAWPADEVVLLSSETAADGARYTALERFTLAAAG